MRPLVEELGAKDIEIAELKGKLLPAPLSSDLSPSSKPIVSASTLKTANRTHHLSSSATTVATVSPSCCRRKTPQLTLSLLPVPRLNLMIGCQCWNILDLGMPGWKRRNSYSWLVICVAGPSKSGTSFHRKRNLKNTDAVNSLRSRVDTGNHLVASQDFRHATQEGVEAVAD